VILLVNYVIEDKYLKRSSVTLAGSSLIPVYDTINGVPTDERLEYDIQQHSQFFQCYLDDIKQTFKRGRLLVKRIKSGKATLGMNLTYVNSCDPDVRLPAVMYVYNFYTKEIKRYKAAESDMVRWEKCDEDKSNQRFYQIGDIVTLKDRDGKWEVAENSEPYLDNDDYSNTYTIQRFDGEDHYYLHCHYLDIDKVVDWHR
jgi:hypothetical protein